MYRRQTKMEDCFGDKDFFETEEMKHKKEIQTCQTCYFIGTLFFFRTLFKLELRSGIFIRFLFESLDI